MKHKILLIIALMTMIVIPSKAVLKEKNINQTLTILREELTNSNYQQESQLTLLKKESESIRKNLISIMNRSNQNGLMLYSQKSDYIFDLTYACHQATEQYHTFAASMAPFNSATNEINTDISRYDSLINVLQNMPIMILDEKAKTDRNVCLTLATNIRNNMVESCESIQKYKMYYNMVGQRLKRMNDYAVKRYNGIQNSIFVNGGETYFTILSKWGTHLTKTKKTILEKYQPTGKGQSQWDARFIFGLFAIIVFYGLISIFANILVIRFLIPQRMRSKEFTTKRPCIILATTTITFAIILGIIQMTVHQNFIIMASALLVEYAWLLGVILISLLLRLTGDEIKSGFRIYSPLMVIGFLVITFRIILIPNELINIIFPPILLLCTLWQWNVIHRHNQYIPRNDMFYTWITLSVFFCSVIASWVGYTLMSVQLLIWWVMELACIQTLTCFNYWLRKYADKHNFETQPISKTWFYRLLRYVVTPVLSVYAFMMSIYWAADVFNLSDLCWSLFMRDFINEPNIKVSIMRLAYVIIIWFVAAYLSHTCKAFLRMHFENKGGQDWKSHNMMGKNVVQILVWGIYIITALSMLSIGNKWLMVIAAGLSTGVGFAMKDILENIYYGASLMTGRVHIGDYIECDGTRGVVTSISYTSTMIESIDGSVIAFQNSQLFTKNYKNLTRNHGFELAIIPIGIGYGCNIPQVRKILSEAIGKLDCFNHERGLHIIFNGFGDNSVDLKILCWVSVKKQAFAESEIKECIYKTLNENNIEIPYPQRDVYIKNITDVKK